MKRATNQFSYKSVEFCSEKFGPVERGTLEPPIVQFRQTTNYYLQNVLIKKLAVLLQHNIYVYNCNGLRG